MSNGNEPAFPGHGITQTGMALEIQGGLTKRELISAMCLQGILSNTEWLNRIDRETTKHSVAVEHVTSVLSIRMADALLKQLSEDAQGE